MKNIHFILFVSIILASCGKEKRHLRQVSGEYEIYKYEIQYFVNGQLDSTSTLENIGTIILTNEKSSQFNRASTSLTYTPALWGNYGVDPLDLNWYLDEYDAKTITLWTSEYIGSSFIIYTRDNTGGNREQWVAVTSDANGYISAKETLYVKK